MKATTKKQETMKTKETIYMLIAENKKECFQLYSEYPYEFADMVSELIMDGYQVETFVKNDNDIYYTPITL